MIFFLIVLAGFHPDETPPADLDSALSHLSVLMRNASPEDLGMFFAEIGLEASPDEVHLWGERDFYDLLMDFSPIAPDSGSPDSLLPLVESLPIELLEKNEDQPVTIIHGSCADLFCSAHRVHQGIRGMLQSA